MEKTIRDIIIIGQESDPITRPVKSHQRILETNARLWMTFILMASDLLSLFIAILVAMQFRALPGTTFDQYYTEIFLLLSITLVISFGRKGLYPAVGLNYVNELREIFSSSTFAFLILIGVTFLLKTTSTYSRLILIIVWALSLALVPSGRYFVRRLLIHLKIWGEPAVIIGDPHKDLALAEYFRINLQLGLRPVAVLRDEYFSDGSSELGSLMSIDQIADYARGLSINTALVVLTDLNSLDSLVNRYRLVFQRVIFVKGWDGSYTLNSLKSLDLSGLLGLEVMNNLLNFWSQLFKRVVDILGSSLGLLLLSPFLGLTALFIKIDSRGSVFYHQRRIGRNGNTFDFMKFRTMHENGDQILADQLACDPVLQQEWNCYQKLRRDPRITRVGHFLRKFSLDELPQLWNVVKGEMSLVGPRPMLEDQRELYGESFKEYVQVTPGMTGMWQVSGRSTTSFARRAELDNEYIQRWSVWLDIFILFKTIKIVFGQQGAY
jgi:Undecaprenyl-phosphate galactose phosphotransferase WbaP